MGLFKPIIDDLELHGSEPSKSAEVDFLRYVPQPVTGYSGPLMGYFVYFYPVSERAKTFCSGNHVMQTLRLTVPGAKFDGWYGFAWDHRLNDNHAAKIYKADPPFTDRDANPFTSAPPSDQP